MDGASRLPGFYPETPAAVPSSSRYNPATTNGHNNSPQPLGSPTRVGGPIRRTPASRARAHSTPYARPPPQNTPGSGSRPRLDDDDDENEEARVKKSFTHKTAELVGTLVSGVKDWFSSSKTPRREHVQSVVPRKKTPQRSLTSRMEEGFDEQHPQQRESDNMFSPSLAPHYAGHTPWIVKQRGNKALLSQEPSIFPLPNTNPGHHRQDSQSKYATLPAKRSNALVTIPPAKRPRQHGSSSSLRPPKEWELSKDRFAEQDQDTLDWCDKYGIDIVSLASGLQKRPPLPSFADIQRYDALRNDVAFFERQGIRYIPRHTRKTSSLRHATSSYELSRIAQENSAIYNSIDPTDSSSSKLHAWRELVRIKESRAKIDRETAQLERSKQRNGYATVGSRTASRSSSRVRGLAGEVSDDVWILPSLRPGSAAGGSSRMRTASPAGSWRSTDGSRRPRGRDVLAMLENDNVPLLLPAPPKSDTASMKDVEEISSPRKKRPGYFSAREEDLDPLEMDVDDFITPARKKQRTSISLHQGPKFAALWEPSRQENWPLPEAEDNKPEEIERKDAEERERVKNELKDLESPAFKLPPSARKETGISMNIVEQPTPTKVVEKETDDLKFSFPKSPTSPRKTETNTFNFSVSKPPASPPKPETNDLTFAFSNRPTSSTNTTENGAHKFSFSFPPASPTKPTEKPDESKIQPLMPTSVNIPGPGSSTGRDEVLIGNRSPSKTATFMQSILSEKAPESQMEDIPEKRNGVKSPETTQSSLPQFEFSLPPTQSSSDGMSQETSKGEKAAGNGVFKFGSDTGFSASTSKPTPSSPPKETTKVTLPSVEQPPKFNFGMPKAVQESKVEPPVETPVETKPTFSFNFGQPKTESPAAPIFHATSEAKKDVTPVFGTPGGLGRFGGAFNKPEAEKSKPVFGATSPVVAPSEPPTMNGTVKESETKPPVFGAGISSGFNFGTKVTPPEPKKEPTTPTATAVPQELDDSMDITDSPPTTRTIPMPGANLPSFSFPTSAPTSAPTTAEPPKSSFTFGQTNSAVEKPTLPSFGFASREEKKAESVPAFGASAIPPLEFASPAPTTTFTGFSDAFPKKNETETQKPVEKSYFPTTSITPSFGAPESKPIFGLPPSTESKPPFGSQAPAESKPTFGLQTSAPAFGSTTPSLFGNTSVFPSNQPSVTSPPNGVTSPPTSGFNFNFAPQASSNPPPSFGSGGSTFSFTQTAPVPNPFASNATPAISQAPFQGVSSAPVSPQIQQLPTFPGVPQFGAAAPSQPAAPLFGVAPSTANFQFAQNIPATPIFTLGAEMQRSSSDAGPTNASPAGRRFAQPGRRRINRRG